VDNRDQAPNLERTSDARRRVRPREVTAVTFSEDASAHETLSLLKEYDEEGDGASAA
jgi:hypothetical protein